MPHDFQITDTPPAAPVPGWADCPDCGGGRCRAQRGRRLFTGLLGAGLLAPAWARDGVEVGPKSKFVGLVSAGQVEQAGAQQYALMRQEYSQKRALAPEGNPQLVRLREIASRLIPFTYEWNERARQWRWEVNLLGSAELNAFCMPGGKIAFYYGILEKLKLEDDEVAAIMGHEMTHALREHARERMGKTTATRLGAGALSALLGLGNLGDAALNMGAQLLSLEFSREDESEADLVGLELSARAGYDPSAAVRLWQKMTEVSKGQPPKWLSTHPRHETRIRDIEANLPKVVGLYERAPKPPRRFPVAPPLGGRRSEG